MKKKLLTTLAALLAASALSALVDVPRILGMVYIPSAIPTPAPVPARDIPVTVTTCFDPQHIVAEVSTGPRNGLPPGKYEFYLPGAMDTYFLCARRGIWWAHARFTTTGQNLRLPPLTLSCAPHPAHECF